MTGTAAGDAVSVEQRGCGVATSGGLTVTESITGGTLRLSGSDLIVSIDSRAQFSGSASGTCSLRATGTMRRTGS